jgi:hypothetical protein
MNMMNRGDDTLVSLPCNGVYVTMRPRKIAEGVLQELRDAACRARGEETEQEKANREFREDMEYFQSLTLKQAQRIWKQWTEEDQGEAADHRVDDPRIAEYNRGLLGWFTLDEGAIAYKMSRSALYKVVRRHKLPTERIDRMLIVHRSSLAPYIGQPYQGWR